jgi:hypothetical protein
MSSILNVDTVQTTSGKILLSNSLGNHGVNFTQCYMSEIATYSSANSGNGTTISDLSMTISPKSANSILIMEWMITGEMHLNNGFVIHKNGSLITTAGQEGYNNVSGNVRYSTLHPALYDNNNESTPSNNRLTYQCIAGTTSAITFAPAVRATGATAYTFYLNRAMGSGTVAYTGQEQNVSYGYLFEFTP